MLLTFQASAPGSDRVRASWLKRQCDHGQLRAPDGIAAGMPEPVTGRSVVIDDILSCCACHFFNPAISGEPPFSGEQTFR